MNWEKSKALTPLKKDFLRKFFDSNEDFFLTGGSALGIFYLEHRFSYDLDFFTVSPVDWQILGNLLRQTAEDIGAEISPISETPLFHRYMISRNEEQETLDFVLEKVPQLDTKKEVFSGIHVDTMHEIAVNKICSLLGRSEQKDVIDLFFLQKAGWDLKKLVAEASHKEGGVQPAILSWLLSQIRFEHAPEYLIIQVSAKELNLFLNDFKNSLAESSFPAK